ncbi:hypothetical protein DAERI_020364 [Deinococcus aerius]|uniref:Uncharacterized protein n=2 Tax=Deinococcus TaxID=1298 RepID=A0A2I9DR43_9DEIO|nr:MULTISPECIES: hypothetical protein [Deinococcus]MBB5293793.1 TRAP-type C4-dicarboxylate transport system permease small subunit [Deinococcus metallilatus]QBY07249.1 hypothetical protein E5F05_04510 [Deinococcus metallilatus]RXJ14721.1 hypothetical protein ERJ73_03240 [Deinococcus metallilatus]TLK30841.1 hypothetical protein FCS05_03555 [Deinococcus metallilatus]GBF04767.1 hypothetical protein DAERI_020364 [Deinococcus aerius]
MSPKLEAWVGLFGCIGCTVFALFIILGSFTVPESERMNLLAAALMTTLLLYGACIGFYLFWRTVLRR